MRPDQRISEALDVMARYKISGVPVTDAAGRLVGILTNRDLRFEEDPSRRISDLMTKEQLVTVPEGTTLDEAKSSSTATRSRSSWWSTSTATSRA